MSANNWRICPKCKVKHDTDKAKRATDAGKAYGKVEPAEYQRLANAIPGPKLEETLPEYYEIGISKDGSFYVDYGATCQKCGFTFSFQHNAKVFP